MIEATVIVAARNAERGVVRLLEALEAQTLERSRFEVIVVDDGSRDGTAEVARRHGLARVIQAPTSRGAYAARNRAIAEASGAVIAVTDADCRPAEDWLEAGLSELDVLGSDLVGGRIEVPLPARPTLAEVLEFARFFDQEHAVEVLGITSTSNLFVRGGVIAAIGPFNERMVSGGDAEFTKRATAAGFTLRYSPRPVVVTDPRRQARALARKSFRIGFGIGQMRYVGEGPARANPQIWVRPRAWRPRVNLVQVRRLRESPYRPTVVQAVVLDVAQYALVQLPMIVGNLAATVRAGQAPRG